MADKAKVKITNSVHKDGQTVVEFEYIPVGAKEAKRDRVAFANTNTADEIRGRIRQMVELKIANNSVSPPDLSPYIGVEVDLDTLPTRTL